MDICEMFGLEKSKPITNKPVTQKEFMDFMQKAYENEMGRRAQESEFIIGTKTHAVIIEAIEKHSPNIK